MKLDKKTFNKWVEWTEKIEIDLIAIVHNQQIFNYFINVVNANFKHIESNAGLFFCDFVRQCYGVQAALGIRRHTKTDGDSISLMRLLEQIKQCASQFTYDLYLEYYPIINGNESQKSIFQDFSDDGMIISGHKIENDIQELKKIGSEVTGLVDRILAHLDKRGLKEQVTYNNLEESINVFNKITCKYIRLILFAAQLSLEPVIQSDWTKIFSIPLDIRKFES